MPKHRFVSNIPMNNVAIARYILIFVIGRNWAGFINIKHSGSEQRRNSYEPTQKSKALSFSAKPLFLSIVKNFWSLSCPLPLKNLLINQIFPADQKITALCSLHGNITRNLTVPGFLSSKSLPVTDAPSKPKL